MGAHHGTQPAEKMVNIAIGFDNYNVLLALLPPSVLRPCWHMHMFVSMHNSLCELPVRICSSQLEMSSKLIN